MGEGHGGGGELAAGDPAEGAGSVLTSLPFWGDSLSSLTLARPRAVSSTPTVRRIAAWVRAQRSGVSVPGAVGAMVGYLASNTPSLLPRPWGLQGLIAAICALFGYGVGIMLAWLFGGFARWADLRVSVRPGAKRVVRRLWVAVLAVGFVGFPFASVGWQNRTAQAVGLPGPGLGFVLGSALVAVVVFLALLGLWWVIERLFDWVLRLSNRVMREVVARLIASIVVIVVVLGVINQVVIRAIMQVATQMSQDQSANAPAWIAAPQSSSRSGSPASRESLPSLGLEGAEFVTGGPTRADIAAATGGLARDPVRVYAGLTPGRSLADVRDAVLAEMERTGAFERAAILVITTTGSGWVNEWNASAFEYLGGGDTAIAAMQYSTLPSALALLSAQSEPPAAGTLLFDAVEHRLASIPADRRPKLYVSGESLGAFGSSAAFSSADDLLGRVDGAVWTGTPEFTPLHQQVTATREGGSTQVNPVVDNGSHFRFTGKPNELAADQFGRELGAWSFPRVVFVQHPTDPVVWWSPRLISQTPDWLGETRTAGPMAQMSWLPFVTFWQVSADLAVANAVPDGFGHQYHSELVPTWAAVLGKDPTADYSKVTSSIASSVSQADARAEGVGAPEH
ncbi:MAG: alpha/beta-hydrolase family protein [Dermatophilaceae bacterium]